MKNSKWRGRNGEAIRFDTDGRLVDGQHRLYACIQAGVEFESLLVTGVSPDDYSTIGVGAKKSFGDFLGPIHGEKNVNLLASSLRLVHGWSSGDLGNFLSSVPSISELEVTYRDHPKLRDSVARVAGMKDLRRLLTPTYAVLIHYAGTQSGHAARVESFFERLGNGLGLTDTDAVYHLRKFLLSQKTAGQRRVGRIYVLALAIKAWNASKEEKPTRALSFKANEEFPVL
jgi:hypothetical protein